MTTHCIERTTPLGQDFVGTCVLCGKRNLPITAGFEQCDNPDGVTPTDALLMAIDGPQSPATGAKE